MAFTAPSDSAIRVAWALGITALAVATALAIVVLVVRHARLAAGRRRRRLHAAWRPVLFDCALGGESELSALARRDEDAFLLLWTQIQDALRGEERERLAGLAGRLGAREMARTRLQRGDAMGRLLALRALAYVGRSSDYDEAARHLDDPRPYVCLASAHAVVHIDPVRAPDDVLPRVAARADWPVPLFATVLAEADSARLRDGLRDLQRRLAPDQVARVLPLVSLLPPPDAEQILRIGLGATAAPNALAASLERIRRPALLPLVRGACEHDSPNVRAQAAAALGRVGEPGDRAILERLLVDREWSVRYRAAQALMSGRFGAPAELAACVARSHGRLAQEIIEHALAEACG